MLVGKNLFQQTKNVYLEHQYLPELHTYNADKSEENAPGYNLAVNNG